MNEEQAQKFLEIEKMILQRVTVSEYILISFAALLGLSILAMVIFSFI